MQRKKQSNGNDYPEKGPEKPVYGKLGGIILLLFILSILINLIPFHLLGIQSRISGYPAIIKFAKSGIISWGTILHRRGLYLAINQTAPGVNMILPRGYSLDLAQLYGLGRTKNVKYKNYNPEKFFPDFDFSSHVVASFNGSRRLGPGPFAIVKGKNRPETMILLRSNDTWYIVDTSLLPPMKGKELN